MIKPKIAVYNEKGRVGKTPIAVEIALRYNYNYATNQNRPREDLKQILPDGQFLQIEPNQPFPILDDDFQVVFDLAGELVGYETSIVSALEQVDKIIVPTVNEDDAITGTAYAITEIETLPAITADIIVVANMLKQDQEEDEIRTKLSAHLGRAIDVVPVRYSKAFNHQIREGCPITDLVARGGLYQFSFGRVCRNLDHLMTKLT